MAGSTATPRRKAAAYSDSRPQTGTYILEPGLAQTPGVAGYGFGATVLRSSLALPLWADSDPRTRGLIAAVARAIGA